MVTQILVNIYSPWATQAMNWTITCTGNNLFTNYDLKEYCPITSWTIRNNIMEISIKNRQNSLDTATFKQQKFLLGLIFVTDKDSPESQDE